MLLYFGYKSGEACNRCSLRRCTGVSSITSCSKLHVGFALLKDTHHCKVSMNSSNGFRNDGSTLVTQKEQPDSSSLQFLYKLWCSVSCPFFGTGGCQIHIRRRHKAFRKQFFHCLQKSHYRTLCIRRASSPYLTICNISGKRSMNPLSLCRNDILMTHQKDRLFGRFSLPVI